MVETPDWGAGRNYTVPIATNVPLAGQAASVQYDVRAYTSLVVFLSPRAVGNLGVFVIWYDDNGFQIDAETLTLVNLANMTATLQVRGSFLQITNISPAGSTINYSIDATSIPTSDRLDTAQDFSELASYDTGNINMAASTGYDIPITNALLAQHTGLCYVAVSLFPATMTGYVRLLTLIGTPGPAVTLRDIPIVDQSKFAPVAGQGIYAGLIGLPKSQYSLNWLNAAAINPGRVTVKIVKAS